jgi:hypothetical protein
MSRTAAAAPRWPAGTRVRSVLLLFGALAVVLNLSVAPHELGHFLLDRAHGLDAGIVLDGFGESHIDLQEPLADGPTGWPEAAGPRA